MGHEDQLPRPSLSDRCRLGEATFAAMGPKEEDAPISDLHRELRHHFAPSNVEEQRVATRVSSMYACATAHYWARELSALVHTVKLMAPAHVKGYGNPQRANGFPSGSRNSTTTGSQILLPFSLALAEPALMRS
jgi:hypothetical protein